MTKQIINAVAAVLFLCFAVTAIAEFPTSSTPAKQDWTRINEDGFRGSFQESCELIDLTVAECEQFEKMQQGGACQEYDRIPQGRVFDKMAFTKSGENTFMENVRVALTNPQHSSATVCQVGKKAVILPHYCDNLAVVNDWQVEVKNPPKVAWREEAKPATRPDFDPMTQPVRDEGYCPARKSVLLLVYEEKALRVRSEAGDVAYFAALQRIQRGAGLESVKKGEEASVSALFGEDFAYLKQTGKLSLDQTPRAVSAVVLDPLNGTETEFWYGDVTGFKQFSLPRWVKDTDVLNFRFVHQGTHGEDGKFHVNVISPSQTGLLKDAGTIKDCRTTVLSAIAGDYSLVAAELDELRYSEEFISEAMAFDEMASQIDGDVSNAGFVFE